MKSPDDRRPTNRTQKRGARASTRIYRLFCVVVLGALGSVAACKATNAPHATGPNGIAAGGDGADGGASTARAHRLYDDEVESMKAGGKLVAFRDDAELTEFTTAWRENEESKSHTPRKFFPMPGPGDLDGGAPPPANVVKPKFAPKPSATAAPPAAAPAAAAPATRAREAAKKDSSSFAPAADAKTATSESITNNQHAEVDEGDIVKMHGEHLVVLRRGRVFTISLQNDRLVKSATQDAFGPDIDPRGTWYDEMVVEGDHVVVVGFSYARGGTEVGLFRIDNEGKLTYRATYHLKSNDYYSARNYASRIVDGRLVFYAPLYVSPSESAFKEQFPAVRRWKRNALATDFVKTLSPKQLYHIDGELPSSGSAALHTVTSCDLRTPELTCESIGLIGPPGRVFYVSPSSVYVWMQDFTSSADPEKARGLLAKLPITRPKPGTTATVSAVKVAGMPTDQFSFEEDDTGMLNVLVRSESNGDAMFQSEKTGGGAALVRLPNELFGDRVGAASARRYRAVPRPDGYAVQNRFVGQWLLYGAGNGYVTNQRGRGQLYATRYATSEDVATIELDQAIDRIEAMGDDAIVVGSRDRDLVFSPVELGTEAHARRDFVRKNASQGEMRSHGFFYKPTPGKTREGIVGLPIRSEGAARGFRYLLEGSASVVFLDHRSLELKELGSLAAGPLNTNHDGCRASCVDWYGNARPIFAKGRIFALMGYELVEGQIDRDAKLVRLNERRRLSFAPLGGAPAEDFD